MTTTQARRVCECGCGVYLRSTNPDTMTSACRAREGEQRIDAPRTSRAMSRAPNGIPYTKPGTMTALVLDAMPGTCKAIAEATGIAHLSVRRLANQLAMDGRATRKQIKKVGKGGERTVYERVA